MHSLELTKCDGRHLTLYSNQPIPDGLVAPSPFPEPQNANPHLRWHPLRGEWVTYAAYRQNRTYQPPPQYNPLAPTRDPPHPTEMPAGDYEIAVFDNRFPSLALDSHDPPQLTVPTAPANGHCEVVVFTQDPLRRWPPCRCRASSCCCRCGATAPRASAACDHIHYVLPFENRGAEVGVTLHHPHGQIYAYPFVPSVPARMLAQEREYYLQHGSSLLCDMARDEVADGKRVLYQDEHAIAFVPACARYPYEVWVMPLGPCKDFAALTPPQRADLARALKTVLLKYDGLWDRPFPYLMAWYQAPTDGRRIRKPSCTPSSSRRTAPATASSTWPAPSWAPACSRWTCCPKPRPTSCSRSRSSWRTAHERGRSREQRSRATSWRCCALRWTSWRRRDPPARRRLVRLGHRRRLERGAAGAETGVAEVLVTRDEACVLTDEIEAAAPARGGGAARLYLPRRRRGPEPSCARQFVPGRGGRSPGAVGPPATGEQPLPPRPAPARMVLRAAGAGNATARSARGGRGDDRGAAPGAPDWTEYELAGAGAAPCGGAGSSRRWCWRPANGACRCIAIRRPSHEAIGQRAMLVFCARRHGLYANLTRFVGFGPAPRRQHDLMAVEAAAWRHACRASRCRGVPRAGRGLPPYR